MFLVSLVILGFLLFCGKASAAVVPTVYEDNTWWPTYVNNAFAGYCNTIPGQQVSQGPWISLAGSPGTTTATINAGDPLSLEWQLGATRCHPTWSPPPPNGFGWSSYDFYRPLGGSYSVNGAHQYQYHHYL